MRTPRLFVDQALGPDMTVSLTSSRAHYLKNVLRCREGDQVTVFNGEGGEYEGVISSAARNEVRIDIDRFVAIDRQSGLTIKLGLGVTKRDAMDLAVQKSTELGAAEITPIVTQYTSVPQKSLAGRHKHWLEVTRSACEQCERNKPPRVAATCSLAEWVAGIEADRKYVAHPGGQEGLGGELSTPTSVALLTGPEGGFSDGELDLCIASGFQPLGLGPRILRADTAPLVLLTLVQAKWGDLTADS
jgi:16S rRNA (uracil1498-N3)-methyltransferase